jgi:hypothetical protein
MIINNLIVDNKLYAKRDIGMNIAAGSKSAHLNEEQALQLIYHLIKVFPASESTEVEAYKIVDALILKWGLHGYE